MKKNKTPKEIVDEIETKLRNTADKVYTHVISIDRNGRIYLPYIELLLYELVDFLANYLGTQYLQDNTRENNIFSSVAAGIEEIKMDHGIDTVTIIERLKAAMNQSRYTFLGLLELSVFNGLVFDVFDEFYTRYHQLLEYIVVANADYKKLFLTKRADAQIYVQDESLLQQKIAEKKREKSELKHKEELLWKKRFSNLLLPTTQTNSKINVTMENNYTFQQ